MPKGMISGTLGAMVAHVAMISFGLWMWCWNENPATSWRRTLLEEFSLLKEVLNGDETKAAGPRATFLYSKIDCMIDWPDIR